MKNPPFNLLSIRSPKIVNVEGKKEYTRTISVLDEKESFVDRFQLMCAAIATDVENSHNANCVMNWIREVESGRIDLADVDGNAWVINITLEKVWFEGLYSQGEGGDVSLSQFKLAMRAYLQFLSDPEQKPIKIEFPDF